MVVTDQSGSMRDFPLDSSFIVLESGECGAADGVLADWQGMKNPPELYEASNESVIYDFGTPVTGEPGTHYKVCWGRNSGLTAADLTEFKLEVDPTGELIGIRPAQVTCACGRARPKAGEEVP